MAIETRGPHFAFNQLVFGEKRHGLGHGLAKAPPGSKEEALGFVGEEAVRLQGARRGTKP